MIALFVYEWLRLRDYCASPGFDPLIFSVFHDNYAKAWQKLTVAEQGAISENIHELSRPIV